MSLPIRIGHDETMAEINITPFTDVLLVLLIIFMLLAAAAVPPGFQKETSANCSSCLVHHFDDRAPIVVEVAPGPRTTIDGVAVPAAQIYAAMAGAVLRHARNAVRLSTHIELIGSTDVPYDAIIRVLDAGRQAGDDDVGLVIR
jgi:biopolymer transport protein ExbD